MELSIYHNIDCNIFLHCLICCVELQSSSVGEYLFIFIFWVHEEETRVPINYLCHIEPCFFVGERERGGVSWNFQIS